MRIYTNIVWQSGEFLYFITYRALNGSVSHIRRMDTFLTLVCIWKFGAVRGVLHSCVICHNILAKGLLKLHKNTTQKETTFRVEWPNKPNSHLVKDLRYKMLILGKFQHREKMRQYSCPLQVFTGNCVYDVSSSGLFGRLWGLTSECDMHWTVYSQQN